MKITLNDEFLRTTSEEMSYNVYAFVDLFNSFIRGMYLHVCTVFPLMRLQA